MDSTSTGAALGAANPQTEPPPAGTVPAALLREESVKRIVDQCKELADAIDSYTTSADKYFGLAGTLGVGALAVLAKTDNSPAWHAVIVVSPIILAVILHYVCQLLTEKAARVGTKEALEEHLATLLPGVGIELEKHLSQTVGQKRRSVRVSIVLYAAMITVTSVGAFRAAMTLDGEVRGTAFWSLAVALLLMGIAIGASITEMLTAHASALGNARRRIEKAKSG